MLSVFRSTTKDLAHRVVFVAPPNHPDCLVAISNDQNYQSEIHRALDATESGFDGDARVLDYRDIRNFGGDAEGFKDATHARPRNTRRLAAVLRKTSYGRK